MTMIPPRYLKAVVAIGRKTGNKAKPMLWIGTGFLVGRKEDDDKYGIYLITNKHVLENETELYLRCNVKDNLTPKDYLITVNQSLYTPHPQEDVDICAMWINGGTLVNDNADLSFFLLNGNTLKLDQMEKTGVTEGSFVYALGYPLNLVSDVKETPICRLGCVSRISDLYVDKNRKQYLVDAVVFPGNSGGPVINYPELTSIKGTEHNSSCNLIGILNCYIRYNKYPTCSQTNEDTCVQTENTGLTMVFPVDYIIETVELERQRVGLDKSAMK